MAFLVSVKVPTYPRSDQVIYASDIRRLFADHMPDATVLGIGIEDHNGWRNRETWQANLWITNDEYLSRMVQDTIDANGGADAASLRLTVEGYMEGVSAYGDGGLLGDIIGLWLDRVDWAGLAESYADWND